VSSPETVARPTLAEGVHKIVRAHRFGAGALEVHALRSEIGTGHPFVGIRLIADAGDNTTDFISADDARAYAALLIEAADVAEPPRCHACGIHTPHLRHHNTPPTI
jgi:hypothetical protein